MLPMTESEKAPPSRRGPMKMKAGIHKSRIGK